MSSERIFQRQDGWYFHVRGDTSMGPYINYREARDGLERYVASCTRQSELSFSWPRWLHVKSLFRKLDEPRPSGAQPRRV